MAVTGNAALRTVNSYTALHVVKLGSSTVRQPAVFDEVAALRARGGRVLLVSGGAEDIALHYAMLGRAMPTLRMAGGDEVRYCPPAEMLHIVEAYNEITLPRVRTELGQRGLTVFAATGLTDDLVRGTPNRPARAVVEGRQRIVRDHRAGTVSGVDSERLHALLDTFDVVCVSPPVAGDDGAGALNVDADVLAAYLAAALDADHLRLVTGTPGLLTDPADRTSTIAGLTEGQGMAYAGGRMRQKVRAAELALREGLADVAITGPHTLGTASGTRFWRAQAPDDLALLARMVEIPSVSGDEHDLAEFLVDWCRRRGLDAVRDDQGNLVVTRGSGRLRLLMLGHLDTVPYRWPVRWEGTTITGRGCVDAKGSLAVFLETIAAIEPPPGTVLQVIGTVEEERTAAGALFVREHHPRPDAVVVGEPSGAGAVTIGYHGVCKARLRVEQANTHTAGRGAQSAGTRIVRAVGDAEAEVARSNPQAPFNVLTLDAGNGGDVQYAEAVIDIRVPHGTEVDDLVDVVRRAAGEVAVEVLLGTPSVQVSRTDPLVRAFTRSIRATTGAAPRLLSKKGSSDMNTVATAWRGVPMIAYGPGDASLDHTPDERLPLAEYRAARAVLIEAVRTWLAAPARPEPIPTGASR